MSALSLPIAQKDEANTTALCMGVLEVTRDSVIGTTRSSVAVAVLLHTLSLNNIAPHCGSVC